MKKTHGMTAAPYTASSYPSVFGIWKNMKQRCGNPNSTAYAHYGGRGIRVCRRWQEFAKFYADMGDPPRGMSLDRINNTKGYSPSNCRWATAEQQAQNSRRAVIVKIGGVSQCISMWCRQTGVTYGVFKARRKKGWSLVKALTTASRKQRNAVLKRNRRTL